MISLLSSSMESIAVSTDATAATAVGEDGGTGNRCQFYLTNKRRHCANSSLPNSKFCGNHTPSSNSRRVPCPIDPSHSVLVANLNSHMKRCPLKKQAEALETKPYYSKGINAGVSGCLEGEDLRTSEAKRRVIHEMKLGEFNGLLEKIRAVHSAMGVELRESFVEPDACKKWIHQQVDRQVPYQEKHILQQVSIVGNMEAYGMLKEMKVSSTATASEGMVEHNGWTRSDSKGPAVVEFGAGRGYLTHMLADCYEVEKIFLVERRSYKLKADRSLRQKESISLTRLRIDIEDLDLHGVESLRGHEYLAIGKHLCGSATDLALRCCLPEENHMRQGIVPSSRHLQGLAIATCCHHLCQWKSYTNTTFMTRMGITKEDFDAITWFSSWAVDGDHTSNGISYPADQKIHVTTCEGKQTNSQDKRVEETIRNMPGSERAAIGFMCKEIIDVGRMLWLKDHGLDAQIVKYVPPKISPENHLLVASGRFHS